MRRALRNKGTRSTRCQVQKELTCGKMPECFEEVYCKRDLTVKIFQTGRELFQNGCLIWCKWCPKSLNHRHRLALIITLSGLDQSLISNQSYTQEARRLLTKRRTWQMSQCCISNLSKLNQVSYLARMADAKHSQMPNGRDSGEFSVSARMQNAAMRRRFVFISH